MTALRAIFATGFAAFWLFFVGFAMFAHEPTAETGVHLVFTGAAIQPNVVRVDPGSPAYRAGLRTGDVLGCLSARDYALLLLPSFGVHPSYRSGTPLTTCVHRGAAVRTVQFFAESRPPAPNAYGNGTLAALRLFVLFIFLFTAVVLVVAKPNLSTWILYAYCVTSAPSIALQQYATVLPVWAYVLTGGLSAWVTTVGVGFLLLFAVLVPDERVPQGWRRYAFYGAAILAVADIGLVALATFSTGFTVTAMQFVTDEVLTALTVLIVIARVATMQAAERARFGWAAFAIITGVVLNDVRNILAFGAGPFGVIAAYLTVIMPLCLMYAILKRHVIDVRFVISRTVVYAALTSLVVGVIGLVDWLTSAYLSQVRVAMAIDAGVTIGLAFALHRAYGWIEAGVDFLLFRAKHDAENYLHRLAKTLLRAKNEQTIDRAVVQAPYEMLDLTMAALFAASGSTFRPSVCAGWKESSVAIDQEHELIRFLATERTKLHIRDLRKHVAEEFEGNGAAPSMIIPLFQGDVLIAFAVYGIHRDGTKLDPDEIETLERLCDTAAQAYTGIELARYRSMAGTVPPVERLQYQ